MTGLQILDGAFRIVGTRHRANRVLFGNAANKRYDNQVPIEA